MTTTLTDLGYTATIERQRQVQGFAEYDIGRVSSEHRDRYTVKTENGDYTGELSGKLRFSASTRAELPAVGDWVAISQEADKVTIHGVLPRSTIIEREAVGKHGDKQIIATNIDFALIVQAVDRDFNINRIERYLTISYDSGIEPIIILTKSDLINDAELQTIQSAVRERVATVPIITVSNKKKGEYSAVQEVLQYGKTYCLLGSSGVGKSTLLNSLAGKMLMNTGSISTQSNRGKHVTSHRELVVLEAGGVLIDNPGMREVGIADTATGLATTFADIITLTELCTFRDCTHIQEQGCALRDGVEQGSIDRDSYDNYLRMSREKSHFESTVAEKRQKDKSFGKMVRQAKRLKGL